LSAQGQVKRLFASNALAAALRVLAVLAFRETRDLALIAAATAAVVAGESLVFIWQMRAAGAAELRKLGWAIARAAASAGVTCACLTLAPGAWAHVDAPRIEALIEGGALGLLTFLIFGSVHALLWTLSGRPDGPEERLADVLRNDQRLLALRASAFRARPRRP
jgi:peptidoglycan biosynthesis protein MviN/MurJ (putative lipid II flippase)